MKPQHSIPIIFLNPGAAMAAAIAAGLRPSFDKKIGDSMDYKDYYKILGVDKKASTEDIKKAYRKLARKYHPDISKEKDADARMAEVNEANTVLSDPEKRAAYDAMGDEMQFAQNARAQGGGGFRRRPTGISRTFTSAARAMPAATPISATSSRRCSARPLVRDAIKASKARTAHPICAARTGMPA